MDGGADGLDNVLQRRRVLCLLALGLLLERGRHPLLRTPAQHARRVACTVGVLLCPPPPAFPDVTTRTWMDGDSIENPPS